MDNCINHGNCDLNIYLTVLISNNPLLCVVCVYSKVVRRTSVNERSSLYRREHQKEAKVWQERGRQTDALDDDEDRQTDAELNLHASLVRNSIQCLKHKSDIFPFFSLKAVVCIFCTTSDRAAE